MISYVIKNCLVLLRNFVNNRVEWAIPEKKQTVGEGGGGVEDIIFPGVLKKENVEFPGVFY